MERTYIHTEYPVLHFTEDDLAEFTDIVLDCYNGAAGNPVIIFFMLKSKYSCQDIDDAFVFYSALKRWSEMPFANLLLASNCDRHHWFNLYHLYCASNWKKRSTKLKKMFLYAAGIKFDY
jgi:hypothetical protein